MLASHVTLAIRHLQDEHILLRVGGLYWVAVDRVSDADILARQFLSAMPEQQLATLVCLGREADALLAPMDAKCGPAALRLFARLDVAYVCASFKFLTSDLHRINVDRGSQILLMVSAIDLENLDTEYLQRWCTNTHRWLQARDCTLLVLCHGQAPQMHESLLQLNERISGLAQLYRRDSGICYQLNFWHSELGVSATQALELELTQGAFGLSQTQLSAPQPARTDDQRIYLTQRSVLEGAPPLSEQWSLFEHRDDVLQHAAQARAASVIIALESNRAVEGLARRLYELREHCGTALKVIVREMEPCLRYRDERLLLTCGANLIVPFQTSMAHFLSLVDSVQGQIWRYRQTLDFQSLFDRLRPPAQRGLLTPRHFIETLDQVYGGASGEVSHQLLQLTPRGGLNIEQYLNQISLRRFGDIACVVDGTFYLFLFACRADGLEPALGNICRLPWLDIFSECKTLETIDALPRQTFLDAPQLPGFFHLAGEQVAADLSQAIASNGYTPQRITLSLSEHCA